MELRLLQLPDAPVMQESGTDSGATSRVPRGGYVSRHERRRARAATDEHLEAAALASAIRALFALEVLVVAVAAAVAQAAVLVVKWG